MCIITLVTSYSHIHKMQKGCCSVLTIFLPCAFLSSFFNRRKFKSEVAISVFLKDNVYSKILYKHFHHPAPLHNWPPTKVVTKSPSQPITDRGLGERWKLPLRGLGWSPSRKRFWCILDWNLVQKFKVLYVPVWGVHHAGFSESSPSLPSRILSMVYFNPTT